MKFILGVKCVPNEECFVLFFPESTVSLVPMTSDYRVNLIRNGRYGIGKTTAAPYYKTPKECRVVNMKVFINITKMYLFYTAKYQMFSIPNECGFTCDYTIRNGKFGVVE